MPLTYENSHTGRVATILDPNEVVAQADAEAERLYRGGTKKAQRAAERAGETGRRMAIHAAHTIERLDASQKWKRVDNPPRAKAAKKADAPKKRAAKDESSSALEDSKPDEG